MEILEKEKIRKVRTKVAEKRVEVKEIKGTVDRLGEETLAVQPEDVEVMFAGKMADMLLGNKVAAQNIFWSYVRQYFNLDEEVYKELREKSNPLQALKDHVGDVPALKTFEKLISLQQEFEAGFKNFKDQVESVSKDHPLVKKFLPIRGITGYQIALIMSQIKDISRFPSPSQLCMYAGCASVKDHQTGQTFPVTKGNIENIKLVYAKMGKEYKGFNTVMAGRMNVIFDCLNRGRGFFATMYAQLRPRLEDRAKAEGSCFIPTQEQLKEAKGKMKKDMYYMKGKKNQSLIMWSHANAKRRIQRTFLHMLWLEWRKIANFPIVEPYVKSYLAHDGIVTLEEVIATDSVKKKNKINPDRVKKKK